MLNNNNKISQALKFAELGIKVFPVHGIVDGKCTCGSHPCKKSPGKHPAVFEKWQEVATTDESQIRKWWNENPDWNIGLLLGPESEICDIEFDDDEGEATAERLLEGIKTPSYSSGRSVHRLFRLAADNLLSDKTKLIVDGLEIRLGCHKAAYSVAPPSCHHSGCSYEWLAELDIESVEIAEFPESVLELIEYQNEVDSNDTAGQQKKSTGLFLDDLDFENTPVGYRHDNLCEAFGREIKHHGFSPELVSNLYKAAERLGIEADEVTSTILPIASKEQKQVENFQQTDVLSSVMEKIRRGDKRMVYPCGEGEFEKFQIAPKTITVIAAPPGFGKTSLCMQLVIEALRRNPDLSAASFNVEMDKDELCERQIANVGAIPLAKIWEDELDGDDLNAIEFAEGELKNLNIIYREGIISIQDIESYCESEKPNILLVDYLQQVKTETPNHIEVERIPEVMQRLRQIARKGTAVVVVSATNRNSYKKTKLGMDCFKGSAEIEFNADDAFALGARKAGDLVVVEHLKARRREAKHIHLHFRGEYARFDSPDPEPVLSNNLILDRRDKDEEE